jgi:hypothetical protein
MILRVAMGISYESHVTCASRGCVSPAYSDVENKVPSFTPPAALIPRRQSSIFKLDEISSEFMAVGFATDLDSTIQELYTDEATKNGPWSAHHRWSIKASPKLTELPSPFRPQS